MSQALKEQTELSDDCRSEIQRALQGRMQQDVQKRGKEGPSFLPWADSLFTPSSRIPQDLTCRRHSESPSGEEEGEEVAEEADDEAEEHKVVGDEDLPAIFSCGLVPPWWWWWRRFLDACFIVVGTDPPQHTNV